MKQELPQIPVRAGMTHADEPLTVDPEGLRDRHFHRALSEAKKYADCPRHAPVGPTCASYWIRWQR